MTSQERKKYRIACILYDTMQDKPNLKVCKEYGITIEQLIEYANTYTTMWVLKTYQEAKNLGFLEDYTL